MKRFVFLLVVLVTLTSADVEVSDVNYKSSVNFKNETYTLNGVGIREKYFIDLYTIGLYVKEKSSSGSDILKSDKNRFVRIVVVSGLITAPRFNKGMDEGFEKTTNGNVNSIKNQIALLKKGFGNDFNVGDEFIIFFGEEGETKIYKSGKLKVTIPANEVFQKALLGMWIGENPVVDDLKDELLGID